MPSQATFQAVFDVSANQDWIVKHLHSAYKKRRRRRRRQRERQKSNRFRFAKQQSFITLFCISYRRHATTAWKRLISRFVEDMKGKTLATVFFPLNFNKPL